MHKLRLHDCNGVDPVAELLPHGTRLETLVIKNCNLNTIANAAAFAQLVTEEVMADCGNRFLPKLKKLEVMNCCLGQWSRLFECQRPSLIELKLNCFHLGLAGVSRANWSDAPNLLWPYLRLLGINNAERITIYTLKSIAPLLNDFEHLEKLIIPREIYLLNRGISSLGVLKQTGHYPLPVGLRLKFGTLSRTPLYSDTVSCPYLREQEQEIALD
jgi:hypothetical protein